MPTDVVQIELLTNGLELVVDLTAGYPCTVEAVNGIGYAPFHRFQERGPMQHGETDKGYRLDTRIIQMVLGVNGSSKAELWNARGTLLSVLRPRNAAQSLRFTLPQGVQRQIDIVMGGGLEMPSAGTDPLAVKFGVNFFARDPTFYDPTPIAIQFGGGGSQFMTVPLPVPWPIGSAAMSQTTPVDVLGTWDAYPVVTIGGPITDFVMLNQYTGEKLSFLGKTVNAGEIITVDTRYGYKVIYDATGAARFDLLTSDSNLSTFRLAADSVQGFNNVRVTGSSITAATSVTLSFYNRYIGI